MMKQFNLLAAVMVAAFGVAHAQTTTPPPAAPKTPAKHTKPKPETATEREIRLMREQMAAQQTQIDALKSQVSSKDQQVTASQQSADDAKTQAAAAAAAAAQANAAAQSSSSKVDALQSTVSDLKSTDAGLTETVITNQARFEDEINSPAQLHYKGITITPVAFFAFEGVYREHSVNSDINTPFNSIPFPSANEGHVSELNFSGRQSRLGALFEGNTGNFKLTGYAEMDFLGTGTSSNNNQSNSYVLRQRQIWGRAESTGGFAVTGGQMWSLVTENRRGTDNRTEVLPNTIDPQYMVGYSWTRQPGLRVQQRFGDYKTGAVTAALSVEQAQITSFTVASSVTAAIPVEYFFAGAGQNGGLYNAAGNYTVSSGASGLITNYANNVVPDILAKVAFDVPLFHFEIGGITRFLRDYYYPITGITGTAAAPVYAYAPTYTSQTKIAGGVFGAARVYLQKWAEVAVTGMAGSGVGRYGSSQLADATLRPDETLKPIVNYHGLFSFETHPTPKLDVYFYYGGEYAKRTVYTAAFGDLIGYGAGNLNDAGCYNTPAAPTTGTGTGGSLAASACASPTRYIQEAMGGLTYRAITSPKYGRLQYQLTYSYIQRNLWSGLNAEAAGPTDPNGTAGPTGPRATEPMVHVSMRYYIP